MSNLLPKCSLDHDHGELVDLGTSGSPFVSPKSSAQQIAVRCQKVVHFFFVSCNRMLQWFFFSCHKGHAHTDYARRVFFFFILSLAAVLSCCFVINSCFYFICWYIQLGLVVPYFQWQVLRTKECKEKIALAKLLLHTNISAKSCPCGGVPAAASLCEHSIHPLAYV